MSNELRSEPAAADGPVSLVRIEAVINLASGSVDAGAADALKRVLAESGREARIRVCAPAELSTALQDAVAARPDLLIVLAGDGTVRAAAQMCGASGPVLAPLAGGTMNVLPYAIYGKRPWPEALAEALRSGRVQTVSGGEIDGRAFYVAAVLGAPALWATAREALREGKLRLAWLRALRALKRAFTGRLRLKLDGATPRRVEALALICPMLSRALDRDDALEACLLDLKSAGDVFRVGARALLGEALGGWRSDPRVEVAAVAGGRAWARGRIPATLDGEPHRFDPDVAFRFVPEAFRVLAPPHGVSSEGWV